MLEPQNQLEASDDFATPHAYDHSVKKEQKKTLFGAALADQDERHAAGALLERSNPFTGELEQEPIGYRIIPGVNEMSLEMAPADWVLVFEAAAQHLPPGFAEAYERQINKRRGSGFGVARFSMWEPSAWHRAPEGVNGGNLEANGGNLEAPEAPSDSLNLEEPALPTENPAPPAEEPAESTAKEKKPAPKKRNTTKKK